MTRALQTQWSVRSEPEFSLSEFQSLHLSSPILKLLRCRNVTSLEEAKSFIYPGKDQLTNPFALRDMKEARAQILKASMDKIPLVIYGDYDVDGVASAAILSMTLNELDIAHQVIIPDRMSEGYGLSSKRVLSQIKKGPALVIAVDNGISAKEDIEALKSKKIQTIVVDHHKSPTEKPNALILCPENMSNSIAGPSLAACGLTFKLCWALLDSYERASKYLSWVALGTVADMVIQKGENRVLTSLGMQTMKEINHVGLLALFEVAKVDPKAITSTQVSFSVAPRINAVGRLGSASQAFKLLTTNSDMEAGNLARLLDHENTERKRVEDEVFAEALQLAEIESIDRGKSVLVVSGEGWHEGVVGIVATRLVERFHKPCLVIAMKGPIGKGSGRSIPRYDLYQAMNGARDFMTRFGGHKLACGFSIQDDQIESLREYMNTEGIRHVKADIFAPRIEIDLHLDLDVLNEDFMRDLALLEPFGIGNRYPVFLSTGVSRRGKVREWGRGSFSFWVLGNRNQMMEAVHFRGQINIPHENETKLDLVYSPFLKEREGVRYIQLVLHDMRPTHVSSPNDWNRNTEHELSKAHE